MNNYDRIARFYDVDMARNMAFDDVGFYAAAVRAGAGRTLELGCGNGRILLALGGLGLEVVGVDASATMLRALRSKATALGIVAPPLCRMDVRALAFQAAFRTVLCPYSLVTYLTSDTDRMRMLDGVRAALQPDGCLIVDAFVPRPVTASAHYTLDYSRPFENGELLRWKRITPAGACNRIERRYEQRGASGAIIDVVEIAEEIRPFAPEDLRRTLRGHGYEVEGEWWDYGTGSASNAQFFTARARPRPV
ncbi:MAG: class I SAM-dependent methyltransferase [Casimicrobiaceae bacterium]